MNSEISSFTVSTKPHGLVLPPSSFARLAKPRSQINKRGFEDLLVALETERAQVWATFKKASRGGDQGCVSVNYLFAQSLNQVFEWSPQVSGGRRPLDDLNEFFSGADVKGTQLGKLSSSRQRRKSTVKPCVREVQSCLPCSRRPGIFSLISASTGLALNQVPKQLPPSARLFSIKGEERILHPASQRTGVVSGE